jgi:alpha-D-ribose 1-methylphosphonate 5-triphosphate synthase subunit PhnL
MTVMIQLADVSKSFTMHLKGGAVLPVVGGVSFAVERGECVVLGGPSGAGKSSILKMIYGSYLADRGRILVQDGADAIDMVTAEPRRILQLRATTLGYVSQFLRAIPRVSALDLVAAAMRERGADRDASRELARALLTRLNLPDRLHDLPPATFSGGEQARVNIARGFAAHRPILLLDEPTASLDGENRAVVETLIAEHRAAGAAIVGIFHDTETRDRVATRIVDVTAFAASGSGTPRS